MPKFTFKILAAASIVLIITVALANWIIYSKTKEFLVNEIRSELESNVRLSKKIIDISVFEKEDKDSLKIFADEIKRLTGLRTTLILKSGEVIADSEVPVENLPEIENHSYRDEVKEAMEKGSGFSVRHSSTINKDLFYYCENLHRNNKIIGFIRFAVFNESFSKRLDFLTKILVQIDVLILVIFAAFNLSAVSRFRHQLKSVARDLEASKDSLEYKGIPEQKYEEFDQIGVISDSIIRKFLEEKAGLMSEKSELMAVVNSLHEGVAAFDNNGSIILMNDAFRSILHIPGKSEGLKYFYEFIQFPPLINDIRKYTNDKKILEGRHKYYGETYIEYKIAPVNASDGKNLGFFISISDVTKIRQLEIIRKDFVANVSHEFKTPLTNIRGYAETLMSTDSLTPELRTKFLGKIENQTRKLENIVIDLLQLSRIEKNEQISLHKMSPYQVLKELVEEYSLSCSNSGIEFKYINEDEENTAAILADENLLKTLLSNLLINALKYSPKGGTITLKAGISGKTLVIDVADKGIGIPEKEISRIFERFYRIEETKELYPEGSGLGLSLAKNIAELFKGNITVYSEKGTGTTFTVSLPLIV